MRVERVPASTVRPLRRAVLRDGRRDVVFDEDDDPTTIHVAALDDAGVAVGVASFVPSTPPGRTWQLRAMAVAPAWQGSGIGRLVLEHGIALVRNAGGRALWAHGRDSALGFYRRLGWRVVGDGYTTPATGLPHHRVERSIGEDGHLHAGASGQAGPHDGG